jgi:hypothetical protein
MLNYKLQNNMNDLGQNFGSEPLALEPSSFYPSSKDQSDPSDEMFSRKKAWAELEREQDEVKSNIKSLMRKAPESNEIENPLLAGRMTPQEPKSQYRVPQDVAQEKK